MSCQIIGDGLRMNLTGAFYASSALDKCQTKQGVVIIADVVEGKVVPGETITFLSSSKNISDVVVRTEIDKKEVNFAGPGKSVGICLANSRLRDIRPFLG